MKSLWVDRALVVGPYVALVLTEKQFHKAMKDCHIPMRERGEWIKTDHSDATVHFLENGEKDLCCIVAIRERKGIKPNQIAAMIVHESVHIWQRFKRRIGEDIPSDEFEAYSIQAISQRLMDAYSGMKAKKR